LPGIYYIVKYDKDKNLVIKLDSQNNSDLRNYDHNYYIIKKGKKLYTNNIFQWTSEQEFDIKTFDIYLDSSFINETILWPVFIREYESNVNFILSYLNVGYLVKFNLKKYLPDNLITLKMLKQNKDSLSFYLERIGIFNEINENNNLFVDYDDIHEGRGISQIDILNSQCIFSSEYILDNPFHFVHEFLHYCNENGIENKYESQFSECSNLGSNKIYNILNEDFNTCRLYLKISELIQLVDGEKINVKKDGIWPVGIGKIGCCKNALEGIKYKYLTMLSVQDMLEKIMPSDSLGILQDAINILNHKAIDETLYAQNIIAENEFGLAALRTSFKPPLEITTMSVFSFLNFFRETKLDVKIGKSLPTDDAYIKRRMEADYRMLTRNVIFALYHLMNRNYEGPTNSEALNIAIAVYLKKHPMTLQTKNEFLKSHYNEVSYAYQINNSEGLLITKNDTLMANKISLEHDYSIRYNPTTSSLYLYHFNKLVQENLPFSVVDGFNIKFDSAILLCSKLKYFFTIKNVQNIPIKVYGDGIQAALENGRYKFEQRVNTITIKPKYNAQNYHSFHLVSVNASNFSIDVKNCRNTYKTEIKFNPTLKCQPGVIQYCYEIPSTDMSKIITVKDMSSNTTLDFNSSSIYCFSKPSKELILFVNEKIGNNSNYKIALSIAAENFAFDKDNCMNKYNREMSWVSF
jgi:hypothetical protein